MFSRRGLSIVAGQWVAHEAWQVVYTGVTSSTADQARADVITQALSGGVLQTSGQRTAIGMPHPSNPYMSLTKLDPEPYKGPLSWIVVAEYRFGNPGIGDSRGPLYEPAKLVSDPFIVSIPADVDTDGNLICNAAGVPFDPPLPGYNSGFSLTLRKALPFYDIATALAYNGATNSDSFVLPGLSASSGTLDVGQAMVRHIKPAGEYLSYVNPGVQYSYIYVDYCFEFQEGVEPYQAHPLNVGRVGWYTVGSASAKGPLAWADTTKKTGTQVDIDVPLNFDGTPVDSHIVVLDPSGGAHTPVANPSTPPGLEQWAGTPAGAPVISLIWRNRKRKPFANLIHNLFLLGPTFNP